MAVRSHLGSPCCQDTAAWVPNNCEVTEVPLLEQSRVLLVRLRLILILTSLTNWVNSADLDRDLGVGEFVLNIEFNLLAVGAALLLVGVAPLIRRLRSAPQIPTPVD